MEYIYIYMSYEIVRSGHCSHTNAFQIEFLQSIQPWIYYTRTTHSQQDEGHFFQWQLGFRVRRYVFFPKLTSPCHVILVGRCYSQRLSSVFFSIYLAMGEKLHASKGHFAHEAESPWPVHFKHSCWWKRWSRSKSASHYA